jgi:hypothetical protein
MKRPRKLIVTLSFASLLWCIAVGLLIWFLPLGSSSSASSSGGAVEQGRQSFSSISGLGPVPLIIPVVLVAFATWSAFRRHKLVFVGATVLTTLFVFLTGFSIGLFYLPAVVALVVGCTVAPPAPASRPSEGADRGEDR